MSRNTIDHALAARLGFPAVSHESLIRAHESSLRKSASLFQKSTLSSVQQQSGGCSSLNINLDLQGPLWVRSSIVELPLQGSALNIHRKSVSKAEILSDVPQQAFPPIKDLDIQVLRGNETEWPHNFSSNSAPRIVNLNSASGPIPPMSVAERSSEYSNAAG